LLNHREIALRNFERIGFEGDFTFRCCCDFAVIGSEKNANYYAPAKG